MRIKAVIIALGVVLALTTGLASAQPQRTDTCVEGVADAYRFTANVFTQHEIRLTANRNNPGIFFLVFDSDGNVRGGSFSNTRSVHWSSGLLRGRHQVWVGCLRSSSYTIQWVNGNEKRLSPPRYVSFLQAAYLTHKPSPQAIEFDANMERVLQWAHAQQLAAEQAEDSDKLEP